MKIKKIVVLFLLFSSLSNAEENNKYSYQTFKKRLEDYGFSYSIDLTYMPQRGSPNGSKTPQQFMFSPSIDWNIFSNEKYGNIDIQFSYSTINYWGEQASTLQNRLNSITGINDYINTEKQFYELLLSYTLPGEMDWLSINIGQYSLCLIDGTFQDYNQQTGFISYALSQNGSATYPTASLGAYLQFTPNDELLIQAGFQNANNMAGSVLGYKDFNKEKYTSYIFTSWSPIFKNNWMGQYMVLLYNQPSINNQYSESNGYSFSFSQFFGNVFNIFGRINGASGNIANIKKSYVAGLGFKNPFNRNENDYLGIAVSFNEINKKVIEKTPIHKYENVIEAQYIIGIGDYITIIPDIQYIINPALNANRNSAFVYSLTFGLFI